MDNTQQEVTGNFPATFSAYKADSRISFIRAYDPRVQAVPMFRHAVIRYRVTDGMKAKGTVEKPAQMVTVPQIVLSDNDYLLPEKAKQVLIGVLEDAQDNIIKGLIEMKVSTIGWDHITIDATLDALTAVRISQRLTREQIENWAKIAMKEACYQRGQQIAEAKGFDAAKTVEQQEATLKDYVVAFGALAAAVPNLGEGEAKALKNMLVMSKCADDLSKTLAKKLEAILTVEIGSNL